MAVSIVMPALEMSQETGKILAWRKREGDSVEKGEPLFEIETDKTIFEVEATAGGVLAGILKEDGAVVPVGEIIAWIVAPGEQPPAVTPKLQSGRATTKSARPAPSVSAGSDPGRGPTVSPRARRMAEALGVDLTTVTPTGPGGSITSDDVQAAADAAKGASAGPAPSTDTATQSDAPLSAIARVMAERTARAWKEVPHFFLTRDVDMNAFLALRERLLSANVSAAPARITVTDLLVAFVARALRKHEKMNASWAGTSIQMNPSVGISLAIAVNDGVVGPVIRDADSADIHSIAARRHELVDRAKSNRLRPNDMEGGTFTISNLGMYGVDSFHAIVTPPQAGILAVGRTADRVVAVNGIPTVRPIMTMTLSGDHRVIDGAQGALFLQDVATALTEAKL